MRPIFENYCGALITLGNAKTFRSHLIVHIVLAAANPRIKGFNSETLINAMPRDAIHRKVFPRDVAQLVEQLCFAYKGAGARVSSSPPSKPRESGAIWDAPRCSSDRSG